VSYYYDSEAADKAVLFIERFCTHVKGEKSGQPFILEQWQKDDIVKPLFGWKHKDTKLRK
jgi:phage terminase large subunit-like protein